MKKLHIYAGILLLALLPGCPSTQSVVKHAHLDDAWYPHTSEPVLRSTIVNLEKQARTQFDFSAIPANIRMLIVPHAGYRYSGTVAIAAYRLLSGTQYDRVFILAPSHHHTFAGIALPHFNQYQTILGSLSVDRHAQEVLSKTAVFSVKADAFEPEHAIEVQLPLLQYFTRTNTIVPLIIGQLNDQQRAQAAKTLAPLVTDKTLIIVSSDFAHYGQRFGYVPFTNQVDDRLRQVNGQAIQLIEQHNAAGLQKFVADTGITICGTQSILLALEICNQNGLKNAWTQLVAYDASNHDDGPTERVSYASIMCSTQNPYVRTIDKQISNFEKNELLRLARTRLAHLFNPAFDIKLAYPLITRALASQWGVFVTLRTKNGQLRGCIGNVIGYRPAYEAVAALTAEAALHDTRFSPVSPDEIDNLTIEISLLTPAQPIANYREIKLGKQGIVLRKGNKSAVYLPDVPTEQGWNLEQTLASLSEKAGISEQAWREPNTTFWVFESIKFQENAS